MKIENIVNVINSGILNATGHTLPVEEYYKFFKFKRSLRKIYENFSTSEADLLKDMNISANDVQQIGDRTIIAPKKGDGSIDTEKLTKFHTAVKSLLNEDTTLDITEKIPLKYYKNIYDENCKDVDGKKVDIFASSQVEDFILDTLFDENL